jgi:hypothetical protein
MYDPRLRWVNVYGRLMPGMTLERARAVLQPLFHQILQAEILESGFAHATPYGFGGAIRKRHRCLPLAQKVCGVTCSGKPAIGAIPEC